MILADKIIDLRKKNGWSQEELADKLGVSRQSISKWEGAQSMPDMNRILKMSEIFGVSTDYLLKEDMEMPADTGMPEFLTEEENIRSVSMEEAAAFLSYKERSSGRTALGVMMCILSPVVLIIIAGPDHVTFIPDGVALVVTVVVEMQIHLFLHRCILQNLPHAV